jgi:exopolysaccharide biosynthesis polyprenyl glycosylphosphotransferase
MTSFRRKILLSAFKLFDLCVMVISFILASIPVSYLSAGVSFGNFLSMRVKVLNLLLFLLLIFVWHIVFASFGLYHSRRIGNRKKESIDVLKATMSGTILIILASVWWHVRMVTPLFIVSFFALTSFIEVTSRLFLRFFLHKVRRHGRNLREVVIVGTNPRAVDFARSIESKPELGYHVAGFADEDWTGIAQFSTSGYSLIGDLEHFSHLLRGLVIDEVALALPMRSLYPQASRVAACCEEQGIIVRQVVNLFEPQLAKTNAGEFGNDDVTPIYSSPIGSWELVIKRVGDFAVSTMMLCVLSPVFLLIAALIALDSPGPVLFSQDRLGLNKRRFRMYKFRTMVADAEKRQAGLEQENEADGPVFKIKNDPRITRIGKFLRKFSLDELPQFFNVLIGDMSLVGPRPLPVRDYLGFEQDWQRRRFSVRPGLTCLWQIHGRSSVSFDQWMDLDIRYIDQWSLWLDLSILVKTIPVVIRGIGAV